LKATSQLEGRTGREGREGDEEDEGSKRAHLPDLLIERALFLLDLPLPLLKLLSRGFAVQEVSDRFPGRRKSEGKGGGKGRKRGQLQTLRRPEGRAALSSKTTQEMRT